MRCQSQSYKLRPDHFCVKQENLTFSGFLANTNQLLLLWRWKSLNYLTIGIGVLSSVFIYRNPDIELWEHIIHVSDCSICAQVMYWCSYTEVKHTKWKKPTVFNEKDISLSWLIVGTVPKGLAFIQWPPQIHSLSSRSARFLSLSGVKWWA